MHNHFGKKKHGGEGEDRGEEGGINSFLKNEQQKKGGGWWEKK